jgi:hypothetical protein
MNEPPTGAPTTWDDAVAEAFRATVDRAARGVASPDEGALLRQHTELLLADLARYEEVVGELNRANVNLARDLARAGAERDEARATNRRLNHEKQRLESELATYRRAISTWEFTERGTYVPLRSITAMGKAAGVGFDATRYEPHYERVERAEAQLTAITDLIADHEGDAWAAHSATTALRGILNGEQPAIAQPVLRDPCPHCESSPALIPRQLMGEHVATAHPEVLDPADLAGYLAPDPPIGCLGVAAEHSDIGTEFVHQVDHPDDEALTKVEADLARSRADWPTRHPGLRGQFAAVLREHGMVHLGDQVPADEYDCCADAALTVLHREWPWLQAEAEELDQARAEIDRLEAELRQYTEAESADAAAGSYALRAEHAEATLARIAALADEHPAGIDTALIHEALAQEQQ